MNLRLIKANNFMAVLFPLMALSYKKVNGKLVITGLYGRIDFNG